MRNKINIGCGRIYHHDWINIDLIPPSENVRKVDIRKHLPFQNDKFLFAYSSHTLEHLSKDEGYLLLNEIHRILKSKGILRLAVPDLEKICTEYLSKLKSTLHNKKFLADYQWICLELYDHMARSQSGGEMVKYLLQKNITNKQYLLKRIGNDANYYFNSQYNVETETHIQFLKKQNLDWYLDKIRYRLILFIINILGGTYYKNAFLEGIFRSSGEIHKYMYDRLSLTLFLLRTVGFKNIKILDGFRSQIRNLGSII